MKTFQTDRIVEKILAGWILTSFIFMQIVPLGWAGQPSSGIPQELNELLVPAVPLEKPKPAAPVLLPPDKIPSGSLVPQGPLSAATLEDQNGVIRPIDPVLETDDNGRIITPIDPIFETDEIRIKPIDPVKEDPAVKQVDNAPEPGLEPNPTIIEKPVVPLPDWLREILKRAEEIQKMYQELLGRDVKIEEFSRHLLSGADLKEIRNGIIDSNEFKTLNEKWTKEQYKSIFGKDPADEEMKQWSSRVKELLKGDLPLDKAREQVLNEMKKQDPVQQATQAVVQGLMDTFGWTKEQVDLWMKQGLLKIDFDLKTLKAKVTFDSSIKPSVNPFDPLGGGAMPKEIEFRLQRVRYDDMTQSLIPFFQVVSASFKIGDLRYEVDYQSLKYFIGFQKQGTGFESWRQQFLMNVSVYDKDGKLLRTIGWTRDGEGNLHATILYLDGSQGPVASRDVTLSKLADGQYHITTVADKDKDGNLLATSKFEYEYLKYGWRWPEPSEGWAIVGANLVRITRRDKNGNLLSEIRFDVFRDERFIADRPQFDARVITRDGKEHIVAYNNIEDLLNQTLKIENEKDPQPQVGDLFKQIIGRDASEEELKYFKGQLASGRSIDEIKKALEAARKAIDDLASQLGLTDEQIKQIRIQSSHSGIGGGCWEGCGALLKTHYVILTLYGNQFEYGANTLRPEHQAAVTAIRDLIGRGTALQDIKIEELGNRSSMSTQITLGLRVNDSVWTYSVDYRERKILSVSERKGDAETWFYADKSKAVILYQPGTNKPTLIAVFLADGRKLEVDLTQAGTDIDLKAVDAAMRDLLNQKNSGLPTDGKLILKKYDGKFSICTQMTGNNSCEGTIKLTLESSDVVYRYEIHTTFLTNERNAPIPSSYQYHIAQFSQQPVQPGMIEMKVEVFDPATGRNALRVFHFDLSKESGQIFENGRLVGVFTRHHFSSPINQADGYFVMDLTGSEIVLWGLFSGKQGVLYADQSDRITNLLNDAIANDFMKVAANIFTGTPSRQDGLDIYRLNNLTRPDSILTNQAVFRLAFGLLKNWQKLSNQDHIRSAVSTVLYMTNGLVGLMRQFNFPVKPIVSDSEKATIAAIFIDIFQHLDATDQAMHTKVAMIAGFESLNSDVQQRKEFERLVAEDFQKVVSRTHPPELIDQYVGSLDGSSIWRSLSSETIQNMISRLQGALRENPQDSSILSSASLHLIAIIKNVYLENSQKEAIIKDIYSVLSRPAMLTLESRNALLLVTKNLVQTVLYWDTFLKSDDPLRSRVVAAWADFFESHPDIIAQYKAIGWEERADGDSRGGYIFDQLRAVGLIARDAFDRGKVASVLLLNADAKDVFVKHGILILNTSRNFSDDEIRYLKNRIDFYPAAMVSHLGIITARAGNSIYSGQAGRLSTSYMDIQLAWTYGVFDHEIWHGFADVTTNGNLLENKRWIHSKLFSLGTREDRPSTYASTNFLENDAEFGYYLMQNTKQQFSVWVDAAKQRSFIGLRTMLSLMEILVYNSEGKGMPIYKGDNPPVYVPVQTDKDHNITMFELEGVRYHFTYTSDSLHILTMTIENIKTGDKQVFENAQGIEHQKTLQPQVASTRSEIKEMAAQAVADKQVQKDPALQGVAL